MDNNKSLLAIALLCATGVTQAGEKEELLKLRNTTTNLIKQLVKQGVLSDKLAEDMIKQAETDAEQQVAVAKAAEANGNEPSDPDEVRVAYVPDFVKDEIRQQVRSELREEVVGDVMQKAKQEKWGVPDALPEWINRITISGDMRLRSQHEYMASDNIANAYFDPMAINDLGGVTNAGPNAFLNTTNDRQRFRERFRLGIDAKITDNFKAGVRLATGNQRDPVSTNQTLGNTGSRYDFAVDRAFLQYDAIDDDKFNWLTLTGGRIANPWFTGGGGFRDGAITGAVSELVWDSDLSFEGFAGTVRHQLGGAEGLTTKSDKSRSVFATVGAFPLQESSLSSDKWLFGGQLGLDWGFANQDKLKVAAAYYDFVNVQAKPNTTLTETCDINSPANNASVPQFQQFGNTLATICNEGTINNPAKLPGRIGLASDYNIVNLSATYDTAVFAPYHLKISGDFAKNVGFNQAEVSRLHDPAHAETNPVTPETIGWKLRADFGWLKDDLPGKWSIFAAYKYLERDAVFDAFTDSDFHLGGTNAKGWILGGNYGLFKHTWLTARWLTANVITGPAYGVDVLQLDLNTRF
ncbi:putative porin [Methylomicrobium lacus]|uniref:putative porin n=1 Tax=Methylomicrobium lacus TaxID=136992 RepID=UPI0035A90666